jgi:ABC-2 type transport system permease protein
LSDMITPGAAPALKSLGGRYFPFAIVGLAFARYFDLMLRMFSESIRLAQVTGCLEAMLSSQTGCVSVVLMSSLYGLISGGVQLLVILVAGSLAFGVEFSRMDVGATLIVLVASMMTFVAFGVLSGAAVVWLKRGDPITWLLSGFGTIVGGAYFPVSVMPKWLQKLSFLLPTTHSLTALRMTMLNGSSIQGVSGPLLVLVLMAGILLPVSLALFTAAVRKGRREGTLMQY